MRYDDIFERPIEEYSDEEIREIALRHRSKAKVSSKRKTASSTAKTKTNQSKPKDKVNSMLEQAMNTAKKRSTDNDS